MNVIQTGQFDIAFVTASDMPVPDQETHLIVDAVECMGLLAGVIPWDSSTDWAQIPLVVIRTPWDYFRRLPEFLAWARRVNDIESVLKNTGWIELVIKLAVSISAFGALRVRTEDVASVNHLNCSRRNQ